MKLLAGYGCTGLLLALLGCGGGGGSGVGASGAGTTPVNTEPQQPAIPQPLSVFDCDSDGPVQGSDVDTLPGGFFQGTLFDCTTNTTQYIRAIVNQQGDIRIVSSTDTGSTDIRQFTGSLHIDGDTFHSSGDLYTEQNVSTRLWLDGYIAERTSIDGRWGTESGSYGFFQASFSYPKPEEWSFEPPLDTEITAYKDGYRTTVTWTFEADGRVSAVDTDGCEYVGQITPSLPQLYIFDLELALSGCALAGTYSGFATAWPGWDYPFVMAVDVDDGAMRSLSFYVGG